MTKLSIPQPPDQPHADRIGALDRVVSPRGGLVRDVLTLPSGAGAATYQVCQAVLGDVGSVVAGLEPGQLGHGSLDGAGTGEALNRAADLAVVEAIERWSSTVVTPEQITVSSADDMGERGIDMSTVPRCSPEEYAHPRCPLVPQDPHEPMRWVTGLDLLTGELVSVPLVMTYLGQRQWLSERWWLPISTGCAAHTDLAAALTAGLFEVVERDALTLTWLHRLPLPELVLDEPELASVQRRANSVAAAGQTRLFDATLDSGIPTVYAVNRGLGPLATVVGAATAASIGTAIRKVLREVQSCRIALESLGSAPDDPDTFITPVDGAAFMGQRSRVHEFDFLTAARSRREVREVPEVPASSTVETLRATLQALRQVGARPVAVDLTTREARRAGLHVVRVIVAQLQPMTFSPRARYLAHDRVRSGPPAAGYAAADVLNLLPQPMA